MVLFKWRSINTMKFGKVMPELHVSVTKCPFDFFFFLLYHHLW